MGAGGGGVYSGRRCDRGAGGTGASGMGIDLGRWRLSLLWAVAGSIEAWGGWGRRSPLGVGDSGGLGWRWCIDHLRIEIVSIAYSES
ncbi:hypothetical protein E2562_022192 [Oryza meyeriana var. granulata]|uniref:Uncharacterized protein n=1 Tax=Oryza meyeriana var. granulata TaxID=110450 RepID=A0A6G1DLP4_9ORYZ|nr:hypothetical protein E2562_022192 [Oryza meyeriana var. granulata]